MSSSQRSSKNKIKPSKSRLASTAAISQPLVEDASLLTSLSAFSKDGHLFAYLALSVDKHRLRVYNTSSSQSIAEYVLDAARVSALSWATLNFSSEPQSAALDEETASPTKKKRKKKGAIAAGELVASQGTEAVVLGLSDGTISFFSPSHGRILRTLSHPSSSTPVLTVVPSEGSCPYTVWSSSADGAVRCWDIQKNDILDSWKTDDRIPYTSMILRPNREDGRTDLLVAHHSIRLLSKATDASNLSPQKPAQLASFTGHASSIKLTKWTSSRTLPARFITMAEGDRFLYLWNVDDGLSSEGKAAASIPLDSESQTFSITNSSGSEKSTLATLSSSGRISIFPIPEELTPPANTSRTSHKIPTLLPRSNIISPSKNSASVSPIINIAFSGENIASIHIARLAKGVRPVFNTIKFTDASGNFIPDVILEEIDISVANDTTSGAATKRYTEAVASVVGAGTGLGLNEPDDDVLMRNIDGDLEVDLAELSLGQRLTAVNDIDVRQISDSSDNEGGAQKTSSKGRQKVQNTFVVPGNSLTRTLIQALHSSDTRLIETCLAHSDPILIRNTVRRLPPQLAIPLITACTERLGRGARAANMKGGGGGASAQRGTSLIIWIKTVLAVHAGHLMTIPDLVARLSGLYATITARLELHETLLSLNGKLDMVLSQVEMRSSAAPAPLAVRKGKGKSRDAQKTEVQRYVEGDSDSESSEADDDDAEVEVESGDDDGSIEDVELGGESDEDEGSEEGSDEDGEDDSEGASMNGFIDDEAEEWTDEEDEDEEIFSE